MILGQIAERLRAIYRLSDLPPCEQFLIDAVTARTLLGASSAHEIDHQLELLLVSQQNDDLEVALYFAPHLLDTLRGDDPFTELHAGNVASFCVAVEGMSHLHYLLWKYLNATPVSQLELELQAEVDKFVCCAWLQQEQGDTCLPLADYLFSNYRLTEGQTEESAARYHLASHLAHRFCRRLHHQYLLPSRLAALHRTLPLFYRLSHWDKLRVFIQCEDRWRMG